MITINELYTELNAFVMNVFNRETEKITPIIRGDTSQYYEYEITSNNGNLGIVNMNGDFIKDEYVKLTFKGTDATLITQVQTDKGNSNGNIYLIDSPRKFMGNGKQTLYGQVKEDKIIDTGYNNLDQIYPVGGIYMSINTVSPSFLFGGTWEKLQDVFLLGANNTNLGTTGGERTHTLSVNEMPKHKHTQNAHNHTQNSHGHSPGSGRNFMTAPSKSGWKEIAGSKVSGSGYHYVVTSDSSNYNVYVAGSGNTTATNQSAVATNNDTGGGLAHNNMPPYLAVNIWIRTQ